tara:strand:+ start:75 stop:662 length:588 start_codon:yes stop_codon:yes gene_type:complete
VREVHNLFSTPVFKTYLDYPVDKIEILCQQERLKNSKGLIKSNLGGWHSDNIAYPNSPFSFLLDIETICQEIAKNELLINKEICLEYAWININQKHHLNQAHSHANSVLSGVYYIKTPEGCGNINFWHPAADLMDRDWDFNLDSKTLADFNTYNSSKWWLPVKEGMLYIFPSWLKHSVEPNMSDKERISISFNVE